MKYVHTNIVAHNWRDLANFYIKVFNCKEILPERNLSGEWIQRLTGIENVYVEGIHLALPGYCEGGPTLEIFSYSVEGKKIENRINQFGFAHIAFLVDHVEAVLNSLLQEGGSVVGDLIEKDYEEMGTLTVVYAKDIEGNIVEIQNWKK